jgi:hypothetical protein
MDGFESCEMSSAPFNTPQVDICSISRHFALHSSSRYSRLVLFASLRIFSLLPDPSVRPSPDYAADPTEGPGAAFPTTFFSVQ